MAENSKIEWTDHTFNPWLGCTKVSDGCKNCYAEQLMDKRYGRVKWGPQGTRIRTSKSNWGKPLRWNRQADFDGFRQCTSCGWRGFQTECIGSRLEKCPICESEWHLEDARQRVFCASLADVFEDKEELSPWREELFGLICNTPHLDWLLLTKRPENVDRMVNEILGPVRLGWDDLPNVWIGTSVENQEQANKRIPALLDIPAKVRFLSCEPLLGPLDLTGFTVDGIWFDAEYAKLDYLLGELVEEEGWPIHWVIVGGESGPNARPMHPDWARSIRDQCQAAGVPFFFKQWGEHISRTQWLESGRPLACIPDRVYQNDRPMGMEHIYRIGKRAAGRLLDGVEHNNFPQAVQA